MVITPDNSGPMQTLDPQTLSAAQNRRTRLRRWIDEHCGGSQATFIASTADGDKQLNQGELSGLLRAKSFGEKKARSLERQAGMPPGYLDALDDTAVTTTSYKVQESDIQFLTVLSPSKRQSWPFSSVTHRRITELKVALGPKTGMEAMKDIDSMLDVCVTKWERVASLKKKSF